MKTFLLSLAGILFPPMVPLFGYARRSTGLAFLAAQAAIVAVFFLVAWGPAVVAHLALWVIAVVGELLAARGS